MTTTAKAVARIKATIRHPQTKVNNHHDLVKQGIVPAVIVAGRDHFAVITRDLDRPQGWRWSKAMPWDDLTARDWVKEYAPHGWVFFSSTKDLSCWVPADEGDTPDPPPCIRTIVDPGSRGWSWHRCPRPRVDGSDECSLHHKAATRAQEQWKAEETATRERAARTARALRVLSTLEGLARDGYSITDANVILAGLIRATTEGGAS